MTRSSFLQESRDDQEEETDVEEHFCVTLPCYTFDEFDKLEAELATYGLFKLILKRTSSGKRITLIMLLTQRTIGPSGPSSKLLV